MLHGPSRALSTRLFIACSTAILLPVCPPAKHRLASLTSVIFRLLLSCHLAVFLLLLQPIVFILPVETGFLAD
jgi:hypothetical protein